MVAGATSWCSAWFPRPARPDQRARAASRSSRRSAAATARRAAGAASGFTEIESIPKRTRWAAKSGSFVAAARWVTKLEYRGVARRTAREIVDHLDSGLEVVEVVGVGASPSCGVTTTLDLGTAVAAMAAIDRAELTPAVVRRRVVGASAIEGEGLFIGRLRRELARRGVTVTFREHDLRAELDGPGTS